ncbi:hypothetical protein ACTL6U_02615 [Rhodovibrionaceae bacterium A322]
MKVLSVLCGFALFSVAVLPFKEVEAKKVKWSLKGEQSLDISGKTFQKAVLGVRKDEGFCFLTRIQLMGNKDQAEVYLEPNNEWVLTLKTDGDVHQAHAAANCVVFH